MAIGGTGISTTHTVAPGDTLAEIANRFYGDPRQVPDHLRRQPRPARRPRRHAARAGAAHPPVDRRSRPGRPLSQSCYKVAGKLPHSVDGLYSPGPLSPLPDTNEVSHANHHLGGPERVARTGA